MPYLSGLTLEGASILHATVEDEGVEPVSGSFDLNNFIGNANGAFSWGGTNYAEGGQNFQLTNDNTQLEGDLPDNNGELAHSVINLSAEFADLDGFPMLKAIFDVPHSTVHAQEDSNESADTRVTGVVDTLAEDTTVAKIETIAGDAAQYWPEDAANAPVPGAIDFLFRICIWAGTRDYGQSTGSSCSIL